MPTLHDNITPSNLWLVDPESEIGSLIAPYSLQAKATPIKLNGACTITLKNCVILEDFDKGPRGENDLLILTKVSQGQKQPARQVHFWQEEIKQGTLIENILAGTVFATIDRSSEPLVIEFKITEVDTGQSTFTKISQTFQTIVPTFGGAFPVLASFAPYANLAANFFGKLLDKLDKDEQILTKQVRFLMPTSALTKNDIPLQSGDYVIFTKPVQGADYYMSNDGLVHPRTDIPSGDKLEKVSYISFSIYPEMLVGPEFIIGQQLETLLEQLKFKEGSYGEALEFLEETMRGYNNIKQLNRYMQIWKKSEDKRTQEEKNLLIKIPEMYPEIVPFLPQ